MLISDYITPVMYLDPSGEFPILAIVVIVALLFTPIGGSVAQVVTSAVSYVGMATWALGDLVFNGGNGAWADMNKSSGTHLTLMKVLFMHQVISHSIKVNPYFLKAAVVQGLSILFHLTEAIHMMC